ncbi:MAG TPA: M48 family metalloprotease [Pyrinomonadaceae bacterium]|nr:M48 family metalloprotease [Pyrinomonadaceae bacterium]
MNKSNLKLVQFFLFAAAVASLITAPRAALSRRSTEATKLNLTQYDDPYSDFRNAKYSNAGLLSERDEIKLGAQLHREVTKKFNLTDVGLARVDRLGQRCASASLRPTLTYKFHVIQDREINGFSLPGGHVYVTTALIRLANDNELGAVLCHEVGHIVARHSLKTLKESKKYDDIANSLGDITGVAGNLARDLGVALGQMVGSGFLTIHSRDEEREADFLGVRGMPGAGFDPQGMITMFQKLQRFEEQDSDLLGSLFSDHPDAEERIANTRYEIARMRKGQNRLR